MAFWVQVSMLLPTFASQIAFNHSMTLLLDNPWIQAWKSPTQRAQIVIGSILLFTTFGFLPSFFNHIEKRNGVTLNDPLLSVIPAHNVSLAIFILVWGMGIFLMIRAIKNPTIYINYIWSLFFVTVARLITISLVPLNPPKGIIIISDPLTNLFYGQHIVTKDLFFSGHTSIIVLATLCLENKKDKFIGIIATIIVASLLLVQHIHYTLDVIAAPIFAYLLFRLAKFVLQKVDNPFTRPDSLSETTIKAK
jgi:hypothetical protein